MIAIDRIVAILHRSLPVRTGFERLRIAAANDPHQRRKQPT